MVPKNILITGASGLIGTRLTEWLINQGYTVAHLGRTRRNTGVPSFTWNVEQKKIDDAAFDNIDSIVHLAGANIGAKRWTKKYKREILESRTLSTRLLAEALAKRKHRVRTFISASATGYYGFEHPEKIFTEEDGPGDDFLANVTRQWEHEVSGIASLGIRVVVLRFGVVLSKQGGVLEKLSRPVKWFAGAPLGSGDQYISWIHIDDLCRIIAKAIEDEGVNGVYNAVAPETVTNREMIRTIAKVLHRPILLPPVPGFLLKLLLGEMGSLVLEGSRVSSEKIQRTGFVFRYNTLGKALEAIIN